MIVYESKILAIFSILLLIASVSGGAFFILTDPVRLGIYGIFLILFSVGLLWNSFLCLTATKQEVFLRMASSKDFPTVDIFPPSAGEEIDLLRNNYYYTKEIKYPKGKLEILVLDDSGRDSVKSLAEEFGFTYLRRPNLGEDKKSGNE